MMETRAAPGVLDEATSIEGVAELAVASGDEHAIKFVEVVQESHWRGNSAPQCPQAPEPSY